MENEFEEIYKKVSKEQFDSFIENYHDKLETHGVYFITPPIICYCDFESGKGYPENIVAQIHQNSDFYNPHTQTRYDDEYFIKKEVMK